MVAACAKFSMGELAEGETQPDWQRGVRPEAGLQAVIRDGKGELGAAVAQVYGTRVIEQRCVFHKLRNVADKAREDLGFLLISTLRDRYATSNV